jgi:hypothetical protein
MTRPTQSPSATDRAARYKTLTSGLNVLYGPSTCAAQRFSGGLAVLAWTSLGGLAAPFGMLAYTQVPSCIGVRRLKELKQQPEARQDPEAIVGYERSYSTNSNGLRALG